MKIDFDDFVGDYRKLHSKQMITSCGVESEYFARMKVEIIKQRQKSFDKPIKVLDFGCGDGVVCQYFLSLFENIEYYGIDISKRSIEVAKQKYSKMTNVHFSLYDGEKIPFEDNTFDILIVACVFHHIHGDDIRSNILNECVRVKKEKGKMYIFEHNPWNFLTNKLVNECPFDEDAELISSIKLCHYLKNVNARKIKTKYIVFFPRKGIFKILLPIERILGWCVLGGQYYCEVE